MNNVLSKKSVSDISCCYNQRNARINKVVILHESFMDTNESIDRKNRIGGSFLILFMLILMLYTAIGLFIGMTDSQNSNMVDIIIRTSSAFIFGYFISSNFVKLSKPDSTTVSYNNNLNIMAQENDLNTQLKNQIRFVMPGDVEKAESGKTSVTGYSLDIVQSGKLQMCIVSSIGICSLILLFITKFLAQTISEASAVISQLRDFVSSCMGFLISCGRTK